MNHFHSYLRTASLILSAYKGEKPFALFIKEYFRANKKYGSRDRKQISHLCYCCFRTGKSLATEPVKEKILMGLLLCSSQRNEVLEGLRPEWNEKVELSIAEKYSLFQNQYSVLNVFPWKEELSDEIEFEKFNASFFVQPDLFLRLRPGKENAVMQKLTNAGIAFSKLSENCLALPNAAKVDTLIELNNEAVIQDLSSQKTGDLLVSVRHAKPDQALRVWDCCTASGGKSIMAVDMLGRIELTVSDVRSGILHNLKRRFAEANINSYESFVADLSLTNPVIHHQPFDLIIADVPCTGSGTWGRTPEQLYYFDHPEIERYASLQKRIVKHTMPFLKPGGFMLYITCSVFKKENEENAAYLRDNFSLSIKASGIIKGYDKKSDTMFAALFRKI